MESPEFVRRELTELIRSGRYDEASEFLSALEKERRLDPPELVLKGRCIQLGSGNASPLEEAESAFRSALAIDPEYVPALLELGFFFHAVEDSSSKALPFFDRALDLCRRQLKEAVQGKRECLEELESEEAAEKFAEQMRRDILSEKEG